MLQGVFYPDDAEDESIADLTRDCRALGIPDPIPRIAFLDLMYEICWEYRGAFVAFHVPTEIGRLAVHWARAVRDPGRGGFSQILWTRAGVGTRRHPMLPNREIEHPHRPRIVSKGIDAHRADVRFKAVKGERYWAGSFVSLQPLAEALSGGDLASLAEACEAFEHPPPPPLDGSLRALLGEVRTASGLYVRLLRMHREISSQRPPTPPISPGAYARAILERAGIDPPMQRWPDFPREILAATASAYFAGDLFVGARTTGLPTMTLDFRGAYAASAVIVGASEVLSAERIDVTEAHPAEVRSTILALASTLRGFVAGSGPPPSQEDLRLAAWTTVLVKPDGAVLPARARKGETWTTRRRSLRSRPGPLWYQVPDLLIHCLEGRDLPRIDRAFTLSPHERADGQIVQLPSGRVVDTSSENLILRLIAEGARIENDAGRTPQERSRLRGLLKGVAVALVSGLPMQVNDDEPTKKLRPQDVFHPLTGEPEEQHLPRIEKPGDRYFPPLAVGVTSNARLLLHVAISLVREMGGTVAYWDTDSVFVVATPTGDLIPFPGGPHRTSDGRTGIRAPSFAEVRGIRQRIEELFPEAHVFGTYLDVSGPDGLWTRIPEPGLLRVEPENRTGPSGFRTEVRLSARAPKRYAISHLEHPGGHVEVSADGAPRVVDPRPEEVRMLTTVAVVRPSEHGLPYQPPESAPDWITEGFEHLIRLAEDLPTERPWWWDEPAIIVVPASFPSYAQLHPDARPFGKLAVWHVPLLGPMVSPWHPGFDPTEAAWVDLTGSEIRATYPGGHLFGETLGQALYRVWYSSDPHALDPDGLPGTRGTEGVLRAAPITATAIHLVGKESRHLGAGREILSAPEHLDYGAEDSWDDVLTALGLLVHDSSSQAALAEELGISPRWLDEISSGRRRPSRQVEQLLQDAVAARASEWLRRMHPSVALPQSDLGVIARYLESDPQPARRCQEPDCGRLLEGRQRLWCSDAHRKKFERDAQQRLDP